MFFEIRSMASCRKKKLFRANNHTGQQKKSFSWCQRCFNCFYLIFGVLTSKLESVFLYQV